MPEPQPPVTEAERDAAVRRLREAYAEGHLSHEEMDARLDQALAARTGDELAAALESVPGAPVETSATIGAVSGRFTRRGVWRVPRHLKVQSALGRVRLDLSQAIIEHPEIDIELALGTGSAKIVVPRDAVVDLDGLSGAWKAPKYKPARPGSGSGTDGPTIRISGATGMGRLKIRHARR
nr:DUF1707 domain-containing protein [Streptomyces coryli]